MLAHTTISNAIALIIVIVIVGLEVIDRPTTIMVGQTLILWLLRSYLLLTTKSAASSVSVEHGCRVGC